MTTSAPLLRVSNLSLLYKTREGTLTAVDEVSFSVQRGSVFGLLGPNGAGKTTLIKILLGIVSKTGGQAFMLGRPAGDRAGRQRVGYLPENLPENLPEDLTAPTNIA